jgi:ABC-type tungstate transport system permease subunit
MLSDAGQAAIAGFHVNGEQLYFPNAGALDEPPRESGATAAP